jgi:hypothetical protein
VVKLLGEAQSVWEIGLKVVLRLPAQDGSAEDDSGKERLPAERILPAAFSPRAWQATLAGMDGLACASE